MRITYQAGGNWVLARRRSPLDSATQVIVADEVYDDKASADLCEEELTKATKTFAVADFRLTSDEGFVG